MSNWNLDIFYPNIDSWKKDLAKLPPHIETLASYKGKLNTLAGLKGFYQAEQEAIKLFYRLYAYIHLSSDLNLKDMEKSSLNQKIMLVISDLNQRTSFVSPELISIGKEIIMGFVEQDEFLADYKFQLEKLFFQQKHVLDQGQEKLLANFGPTKSIASSLHQALSIVDAVDTTVTLSTGTKQTVTLANFRSLLQNAPNAMDRKLIFEATFKRYVDNKNAFASTYNLVLQQLAANYKSRNYKSSLDSALFKNNIPTSVYHNLIDTAYENTASIKKYIALRKKHLGIKQYFSYDRFVKLIKDKTKYPYNEARELFLESISQMDAEFIKYQRKAVEDGFIDAYPKDGKRTGAYSSGFYGYHPFILLNHDETLDSVFTLAHEAGHSAHTMLSNDNQPLPTSNYTIFVAEIASTFNEHILLDHLLEKAKTKSQKIDLLESAIEGIMGTFFRQSLFATFELRANELVEKGIPVTQKALSQIMIDLDMHYYGIDTTKEKGAECSWAYIPHFYHTPFYVYQYATSYSASLKIYDNVKNDNPNAMNNYLELLKSGGSDYPVNQAAKAGADLTNKDTFVAVIKRYDNLVDQLEKVLEQK